MKITILSQYFYPEQFLISQLASELKNKGHDVHVLTGLPNYPKGEFFQGYSFWKGPFFEYYNKDVPVYRTPILPRGKGFFRLSLNYLSFILSAFISTFRIPKSDIYLVYATSPITSAIPAIIHKFFSKTPVVIWLQDLWPESLSAILGIQKETLLYKVVEYLVRWIYKNTDYIFIQSPRFKENLSQYNFPLEYSDFIPSWGEELSHNPENINWINSIPNDKFKITFAGNIGIAQSIDTIFEAAILLKENNEILFLIVGDGRELERLKKQAKDINLNNIIFFGRKQFQDMATLFQKSDALLVTLKKQEISEKTIPAKAVQYLAAKKPIISGTGGITNELITQAQAGLTVEPENPKELAAAILSLSKISNEDREKMGENAYTFFKQNFTKKIIINKIEESLNVIQKKSLRKPQRL